MRAWQTQNGLPDNAVETVVQTRDGYLWLATYDGLARFDGVAFTVFDNNNTPEMRSSRVTSLFEDAEGNLWIGCESGELTRYRDGHFYSVSFHPPWESRKIQNMGADASGRVWLLNPSGKLVALDGQAVAMANAGGAVSAVTLTQSRQGTIWVYSDGQVYTLDRGRLLPIPVGLQSQDYVEWICSSGDGGLWMMTRNRVLKWDGTGTGTLAPARWAQAPSPP